MTPKVSIVFTSYNHREFLRQAVDSLLAQTFKDFELIIIDDCSTDGSQEILKSYNDSRIRLVLKEENSGSYVTSTNYGASLATAPYVIFAQCDDWAEPTQIEKLISAIESHDVGVVFSCSKMVDENGHVLGEDFESRETKFKKTCGLDRVIPKEEMQRYFSFSCVIPNLSAALIKRDLFEKMKGLSSHYLVLADWDLWLRMSFVCDFYYIREPLNNFRQHAKTIRSSIKMQKQIEELFMMLFGQRRNFMNLSIIPTNAAAIWFLSAHDGFGTWCKSFVDIVKLGFKYTKGFGWYMITGCLKAISFYVSMKCWK